MRKTVEAAGRDRHPLADFPACFFAASLRGFGASLPLDLGARESGRLFVGHGRAWVLLGAVGRFGTGKVRWRWDWHVPFLLHPSPAPRIPSGPCTYVRLSMGVGIQTGMRLFSAGGCLGNSGEGCETAIISCR